MKPKPVTKEEALEIARALAASPGFMERLKKARQEVIAHCEKLPKVPED